MYWSHWHTLRGGRTYGRTYIRTYVVRTDVDDVMAIKPNFLTSMGYHIFLTMVLRARSSAIKKQDPSYLLRESFWMQSLPTGEFVQFSEWASQIVPVRKANGNIRLCGNYKTRVNKVSHLDIPRVGEMFASSAGGTVFSKLDMSDAYAQVEVNED